MASYTERDRYHGSGAWRDGERRPSRECDKINFESGKAVREGDVLVELDTRQEKAQLAALEAQRDLAKVNFGRMKQLVNEGVISRVRTSTRLRRSKSPPKRTWRKSRPRSSARRFERRSPEFWAFARSISGQYLSAGDADRL